MDIRDVSILTLPGFGNSEPGHWQSQWEAKLPAARRVIQPDWSNARRVQWVETIVAAVNAAEKPVMLIAHSLGAVSIAHAAPLFLKPVAGAFMVALSNVERDNLTPGISRDFAPIPRQPLPFPSVLVASRNDPFCAFDIAAAFAAIWGATLIDAGDAGHIHTPTGYGPWPEGFAHLTRFIDALER